MQIITGLMRGMKLESLEGERTRPTSGRAKNGLFSAIQFDIAGRRVLDLFAGSGQLGLEAVSRGAKGCVFVDSGKDAVQIITRNVNRLLKNHPEIKKDVKIVQEDALSYIVRAVSEGERFNLIFSDPPYGSELNMQVFSKASDLLAVGGILICEIGMGEKDSSVAFLKEYGDLVLEKEYSYGRAKIVKYRKKPNDNG